MLSEDDVWSIALRIHALAEVGSREHESARLLIETLRNLGFSITSEYLGIPTAFRAEKRIGDGPTVVFLAEYDALPGVGHACGHNIIAASAVYAAAKCAERLRAGRIVVIGTPDEEGSGKWSGSKILLAEKGAFSDVDFVLMTHPGDSWSLGSPSLAVQDFEVTFRGVAAHEAASPEKGVSALDAAILTYTAVNMLRQHVRRDANVVIHGVIREGGKASNVTPDTAVLVYGIRSSDLDYLKHLIMRFKLIVQGCALATNAAYSIKNIGPIYSTTKFNYPLIEYAQSVLTELGVTPKDYRETTMSMPRGSTDFANVSQLLPALEITCKIAPEGTPWHSEASARAAASSESREALQIVSEALARVAIKLVSDPEFAEKVKEDFRRHN
ncbi:MAG: amidohydrolase [Thermoprotei archaeon]